MRGQGSIPLKNWMEILPMAVEVVVFTSAVAPSGVNIGDFATFLGVWSRDPWLRAVT